MIAAMLLATVLPREARARQDVYFDIDDDDSLMGLRDIAAVFPFAGPFAPGDDGAPGDRFLHDTLTQVDRTFANQLLPVLQARFAEGQHPCDRDVDRYCPHSDAP